MNKISYERQLIFLCLVLWSFAASALPRGHFPGYAPPPLLGARVVDMASPELAQLGLDYGVGVVEILPGGPAAQAGLLPGDILTSVGGKMVYSVERLLWLLRQSEPDKAIGVEYQRGGERMTTDIRLRQPMSPPSRQDPGQGAGSSYLGVRLQTLSADLREAFGVAPGQGVLVSQVMEESPAKKAGVRAGDVIVRLDRKSVQTITDLRRAIAFFEPGDQVEIEIIRDSTSQTLKLTLEARPWTQNRALSWQYPQDDTALREMLPPPEYWRQLMDRMMHSLEDSWKDMRDHWRENEKEYY